MGDYFANFLENIRKEIATAVSQGVSEGIKKYISESAKTPTTEFLTRCELQSYLKLSLPTIDALIEDGFIPSYRIGKSIRFKKHEIENCLIKREFKNRNK
jgi:excisionase family DNA binding protein